MQIGSKMGWLCLARTLGRLGLRLRKGGNGGNTSRRVDLLDFTPSEAHNSARPFIPQSCGHSPWSHNEPYRDIQQTKYLPQRYGVPIQLSVPGRANPIPVPYSVINTMQ